MKKIVIMGIPHHGNLGDNAIAYSEEKLIKTYFNNYEYFEMPEDNLYKCAKRVKKFINDEDIILLHGGGNIGDTYETPEKGRREVIKQFPNNKIIVFPQTAFFSDTEKGKEELEKSKEIYNSHKKLTLLAREKKSYRLMKEYFDKNKIYLTPDIVMTLKIESNQKRENALLLFRNDKEKTLNNDAIEKIKNEVTLYKFSDMNVGEKILNNVAGKYRDCLLNNKFDEFKTAELVITDRLHGMIFAAITETPCIVFSNFNHKIEESYSWLSNLNYIKYCNNIDKIGEYIQELKGVKDIKYDNSFALNRILEVLKSEIEGNC